MSGKQTKRLRKLLKKATGQVAISKPEFRRYKKAVQRRGRIAA